jgi:hypothetical protein
MLFPDWPNPRFIHISISQGSDAWLRTGQQASFRFYASGCNTAEFRLHLKHSA